jgi:uncharacterized membrane protein YdjX (TVP38/TMEM64 family)
MLSEEPRPFSVRRLVPLGALVVGAVVFIALGSGRYLTFAALADNREWLLALVADSGAIAALAFIVVYAALVALSFPAAELLTIAGGFLFGRWLGTFYAVIAATIGATVVFLAARAGLAGLAARAGPWAQRFEAGFRRDALSYLLVLRLIPLFPFWLVNLVAGAAGLRLSVFVAGTFFGILPGTFVYANLGTGLGALVAAGRRPGLSLLLAPSVLLPILGLAGLSLVPVLYRRRRERTGGQPT